MPHFPFISSVKFVRSLSRLLYVRFLRILIWLCWLIETVHLVLARPPSFSLPAISSKPDPYWDKVSFLPPFRRTRRICRNLPCHYDRFFCFFEFRLLPPFMSFPVYFEYRSDVKPLFPPSIPLVSVFFPPCSPRPFDPCAGPLVIVSGPVLHQGWRDNFGHPCPPPTAVSFPALSPSPRRVTLGIPA